MATKTYQQQLEEVQTAITQILSDGVSAMREGERSLTALDLPALQTREEYLRKKIAAGTRRVNSYIRR